MPPAPPADWNDTNQFFDSLTQQVRRAHIIVTSYVRENENLRAQVAELESEIATLQAKAADGTIAETLRALAVRLDEYEI